MAVTDLLMEGLRLMAIGMGIVFSFLLLLVGVLRLMSAVALRISPEAPPPAADPATITGDKPDEELIAVITAAVTRYRQDRCAHT